MEMSNVKSSIFIIQTCIVFIGTISNVFSFIVWSKGKVCRTLPIALYFRILAAVDTFILLVPGIELLLYVSPWNISLRNFNQVTCRLYPGLLQSSLRVSSWIISCLSIERTLYVFFPTKFRVSHNSSRTLIIIACLVIASLLMDLPLFIRSELLTKITWYNITQSKSLPNVSQGTVWTHLNANDPPGVIVNYVTPSDTLAKVALLDAMNIAMIGSNESAHSTAIKSCDVYIKDVEVIIDVVTKFLIPFIILICCNILILTQFRGQHRFCKEMGIQQRVNEVRQARYRNAIYQMVGVSFFHCISTAPWSLLAACRIFGFAWDSLYSDLLLGFNSLSYLNSAINVILFCFIGNNFRSDARSLFCVRSSN